MQKRQTLTVDASYDKETGTTGIGIVIQETDRPRRDGMVIDRIAECYTGIPSGLGEMFAIYRALELGAERGFSVVKIRSDYNSMRTALKQSYERGKEEVQAGLQGSIINLSRGYYSLHFGYIPRRKNQTAHNLARKAIREQAVTPRADLCNILTGTPRSEQDS